MEFQKGIVFAMVLLALAMCAFLPLLGLANVNRAVGERKVYGAISRSLDAGTAAVRADTYAAHWEKYMLFMIAAALYIVDRAVRGKGGAKKVTENIITVVERGVEAWVDGEEDMPYPGEL